MSDNFSEGEVYDLEVAKAFKAARMNFGYKRKTMGHLLGLGGTSLKKRIAEMEVAKRKISGASIRLMRAYLEGYRPHDWPPPDLHEAPED